MAESMEGVVTEAEAPKTENVEQKAIAGGYFVSTTKDGFNLETGLHKLHDIMASSQNVSKPFHEQPGVLRPPVHTC